MQRRADGLFSTGEGTGSAANTTNDATVLDGYAAYDTSVNGKAHTSVNGKAHARFQLR